MSKLSIRIEPTPVVWCLLIIATVSVHDSALVLINDEVIYDEECNPMGRWLISVSGGSIWLFIATKLIGSTTVCTIILVIQRVWPQTALRVAQALAGLQLLLLVYLSLF